MFNLLFLLFFCFCCPVSTLHFKVGPSPSHSPSPPPEYNTYTVTRTGAAAPPPPYARAVSLDSATSAQPVFADQRCFSPTKGLAAGHPCLRSSALQLSTSLSSAFSPVQPSPGTARQRVRRIPLALISAPFHSSPLPAKPARRSPAASSLPPSPHLRATSPLHKPGVPQPTLPITHPLTHLPVGKIKRPKGQAMRAAPSHASQEGRDENRFLASTSSSFRRRTDTKGSCLESGPECHVPTSIAHRPLLASPSFPAQQLYHPAPIYVTSPPFHTALSQAPMSKKTPSPMISLASASVTRLGKWGNTGISPPCCGSCISSNFLLFAWLECRIILFLDVYPDLYKILKDWFPFFTLILFTIRCDSTLFIRGGELI